MAEFDENEMEFATAAAAMIANGYTPDRCRWLVTCVWLSSQDAAAVQAKRDAMRVVGDVPPGANSKKSEEEGHNW